jgi:desulfoferrodoxin-like iron-binding protein
MNKTGKRYTCSTCGSELLVTRGGEGTLGCCGKPMDVRNPRGATPRPEGSPNSQEI